MKILKHSLGTVSEPHDPVLVYQYDDVDINNWNQIILDFAMRGGEFELVHNGFKYTTSGSNTVIFSLSEV